MAFPTEPPLPGQTAPDFTLPTDKGNAVQLSSLRGRPVVLFFYPQANTEGCTREAVEFSALIPQFAAHGATVAGISPDSVSVLAAFRKRHGLETLLLSDPDHRVADAYGLWRSKKTFGRAYTGLVRTTVIVGADGIIAGVYEVARIKGHAALVLARIAEHRV